MYSSFARFSFVAYEGAAGHPAGIAVVDHHSDTVVERWLYPGGGRPHGLQLDQQAASRAEIDVGETALLRRSVASIRLACGVETALVCRGRLSLVRGGLTLGSARFDLDAGESARVAVRLRRRAAVARAVVTVRDGLDNVATLSWPVRLRAGR